jgi:hypothetical protein
MPAWDSEIYIRSNQCWQGVDLQKVFLNAVQPSLGLIEDFALPMREMRKEDEKNPLRNAIQQRQRREKNKFL